jgi:hypothetical protein
MRFIKEDNVTLFFFPESLGAEVAEALVIESVIMIPQMNPDE